MSLEIFVYCGMLISKLLGARRVLDAGANKYAMQERKRKFAYLQSGTNIRLLLLFSALACRTYRLVIDPEVVELFEAHKCFDLSLGRWLTVTKS